MGSTSPEGAVPGAGSGAGEAGSRPVGVGADETRERTFEELQRELEDIVARLERGDVAVDDAITLYRKGEELYRACVERLEAVELRIEELTPPRPQP